jgi:hypothetical protein
MTALNNFAADILNGTSYQTIQNAGVKAAVASIATQLQGYRSQGTAIAAVGVLRDLVEDVQRAQVGQVGEAIIVPAASAELLLSDPTAVTALTTIRTYFAGLSTANVPPEGALQSKTAFVTLVRMLAESI